MSRRTFEAVNAVGDMFKAVRPAEPEAAPPAAGGFRSAAGGRGFTEVR